MKRISFENLVYTHLFPNPKPTDPQNWNEFVHRNLVLEVRHETASFYGSLDTREAQYPGLDYSHPPHRKRLSRFTWHRRFFRAMDQLGLTKAEIASLTHWEGTLWAKERFEREQGHKILDTTSDGIELWVPPSARVEEVEKVEPIPPSKVLLAMTVTTEGEADSEESGSEMSDNYGHDCDEDDDGDVEMEGDGMEHQRLHAGQTDEEYEEWLKSDAEGEMGSLRQRFDNAGELYGMTANRATPDHLPTQRRAILEAASMALQLQANYERRNEVSGVTSNSRESFRPRSYTEVREGFHRSMRIAEHVAAETRRSSQISALRSGLLTDAERRREGYGYPTPPRQ